MEQPDEQKPMKPVRIFRHHEWVGAGYLLEALKAKGIPSQVIPADREHAVERDPAGRKANQAVLDGLFQVHLRRL